MKSIKGPQVRPTSDRLKETLFNIIRDRIPGAIFLDCFAGSGAIGIEALSRGAEQVFFIESSPAAVRILQQNLQHCGITEGYKIIRRHVWSALQQFGQEGWTFDLIFIDPPYASELYEKTLLAISQARVLPPDGIVVVEHYRKRIFEETYGILKRYRTVTQGDSSLTFYAMAPLRPIGTA